MRYQVLCGMLVTALAAGAPQSASSPSFEVAVIRTGDNGPGLPPFMNNAAEFRMRFQGGRGTRSPERIDYRGVTLKMLIQQAYHVLAEQVTGPDWVDKQRYTITAKLPPETALEQSRLMLQNLLSEQFQLRLHREVGQVHVYHLVVSKNGPNLPPGEEKHPVPDGQDRSAVFARLRAQMSRMREEGFANSFGLSKATASEFAESLSSYVDRPVLDQTQLEGVYKFSLKWGPEGAMVKDGMPQGPSIFAALEQRLGLSLKASTDQLESSSSTPRKRRPLRIRPEMRLYWFCSPAVRPCRQRSAA